MKGHSLYIGGRDIQATTSTKFLDIKYVRVFQFYGLVADLIETNYVLRNIGKVTLCFSRGFYKLYCYVHKSSR